MNLYCMDTFKSAKEMTSHSNKLKCNICEERILKGERYWFWPDPYRDDDSERADWGKTFRAHLRCLER